MIAFVLLNIVGVLLSSLQGLHLGYLNSVIGVAGNFFQIVLVVILVPRFGVAGLAWAQVTQYLVSLLALWIIVRRKTGINTILPFRFSKMAFREMLGFSLTTQFANIANGLFEPCSKILVGHFGGLNALGTYELAYKTLWLPRSAVVSGATAMLPAMTALAKTDIRNIHQLYRRAVRLVTALVITTSIVAMLASPLISMLWIGHFEVRYTVFMGILAVGIILNAWGAAAYNLGLITGRMRNNIIINVLMLLLLTASAFVAFEFYGDVVLTVVCVSMTLGAGGIAIRLFNEKDILGSGLKSSRR
jgi:O-antigen/teichoic acid export membrane protein